MSDAEIAAIVRRAATKLQQQGVQVLTVEAVDARDVVLKSSGWCEIGRIHDALGRFWFDVLYHPATDEGRLVRGFPKAKRGVMGEILPDQ